MSEVYRGKADDRRYKGEDVDITYSVKRCIHAAECVNRLSEVFDTNKRPWINPDGAAADKVANAVELCPSGALHYDRKDDGAEETAPTVNRVILWEDGPVQIHGDLTIKNARADIESETRVTLCRCGASENKPFCDNTHKKIDFVTGAFEPKKEPDTDAESGGKLIITAYADGPVELDGNFQIEDQSGNVLYTGAKTWLCRCGHSSSKPFCDQTHKKIDFKAE